ncbi:MAG: TetR/AcrR family transcriptional regulator [Arcobacter sp.]|nr:TetR/AcrR family transcriptional regulator [Arcobacter sp.]
MTTKEKLLAVTFEEIYDNGYYSTSVDKILKKAKMNKGSMYHYFKSKKELVLAVIDVHVFGYIDNKYNAILDVEDKYIDSMFRVLRNKDSFNFTLGCRLNSLVQELSHHDKDFKEALEKVYIHFENIILKVLEKASENKEIEHPDLKNLSIFVVASIEGCLSTAKKSQDPIVFSNCMEQLEYYFKHIRKNK